MGICLSLECEKCKISHNSHLLYCQKFTHQRAHCGFHKINNDGICIHCGKTNPCKYDGCYHNFKYHIPFLKSVL